ncbi:MAG: TetR/AcrR family transcriptional regulator [Chloroflexota bacterium]|nr:TetR/AcrR family transcriptional regulator [Chloroflexota bacterium]
MYQMSTRRGAFPRPSLRERKKTQTRSAIINRAVELFNTQGFYNTSIDDIADAADVSRGTFFNYFGYKEAVIVEFGRDLMINLTAQVDRQIAENVGAERIIYRIWLEVRSLLAEHGEAVVVLSHELLNPDVERAVRAAQAFTLAELIEKVTATGQRAGRFRSSLDAGQFGQLVANLIVVSVATQYRTNDMEAADAYMRQSLNVIFHGAIPEGVARKDDWTK